MNISKVYLTFLCAAIALIAGCKKDEKAPPPPTAPVVTTAALTNITTSGATAGGSITSDGGDTITAAGIVWSETNGTPTLSDSVVDANTTSGTFTVNVSGLDFNKSYYIRAFATNSVGTGYGDVVTLNTPDDTTKVKFTYNGEEVMYNVIVSPTSGRKWMDRNLGAKRAATAMDDYEAYGDLFQWGRPDDGHQLINWTSSTAGTPVNGITETLATSDNPGHADFIKVVYQGDPYHGDWRSDNNGNRWNTTPKGPCPEGWHVPTIDEWKAEIANNDGQGHPMVGTATNGGIINRNTAYELLKITVAGLRNAEEGSLIRPGVRGFYWSSTSLSDFDYGNAAQKVQLGESGTAQVGSATDGSGQSVRCLKD